jgi:DNA-binding transcriptional ArsR family regulator
VQNDVLSYRNISIFGYLKDKMAENKKDLNLISFDILEDSATYLKVMAHPVRLRIADILMQGEFPVYKIADICGIQQHQISEHLRLMQSCGLLTSKRSGRSVYYSIISNKLPELLQCISAICSKNK